ncbi:MAG: hypothetical protein CMM41_00585 [Rhodospirillaceae bacterium]|nr:hypothetical protein [Rhodospirillaceae bacterium]|tara:strand:+ start:673 stop:1053 length:381 start_codon:yes stop_codon:yes gene_type:complete
MKAVEFAANWVGVVNKKSVTQILGLYSESATLLPTFSAVPAKGHNQIETYFRKLLSRDAVAVELDDGSVSVDDISANIRATYGTYTFLYSEQGVQKSFPARFTFVLDTDKLAPIIHHHSSLIPPSP